MDRGRATNMYIQKENDQILMEKLHDKVQNA